jgi:hypothetical protein
MKKIVCCIICILFLIIACNKNDKNSSINELKKDSIITSEIVIQEKIENKINEAGVIQKYEEFYFDMSYDLPYYEEKRPNRPFKIENGKYYILDFNIDIRNQPSLNGEVIGQLQLNDEIEIIENMRNALLINGVLQYWYKIVFGNIEGYIWGGNIAVKPYHGYFVYDINENGENDYFYYRISYEASYNTSEEYYQYFEVIMPNDIYIYINNSRISTSIFHKIYNEYDGGWHVCSFYYKVKENIVMLCLANMFHELYFEIDSDGIITFLGAISH